MTDTDTAQDIDGFVREIGRVADNDARFARDIDLFDHGYLDSLGIVALSSYLEERYDIELADQDMFDPRLTTIDGIVEIIESRTAARRRPDRAPHRPEGT